jgi:hypothetical protein
MEITDMEEEFKKCDPYTPSPEYRDDKMGTESPIADEPGIGKKGP